MSFCSIHTEPLKRSKRCTAAARLAYQSCSVATDCFRHVDYRRYAPYHVGGCVLLPVGAPAEFAHWEHFRTAAVSTETRKDAQEGRILDFALPRGVPRGLLLPLAAFALVPFLKFGMAVRLDVECVDASDGRPNQHAHSWISQRVMEQHGFGPKERIEWVPLFLRDSSRHVRALVSARLTLGCAILGIDAYVDPRRNEAKGGGSPEGRRPRWMFCARNEGRKIDEIEQLMKSRELKRKDKVPKQPPGPKEGSVIVTNAATYYLGDKRASELRMRFADLAQKAGYELRAQSGSPAVALSGASVAFDGRKFRIAATGGSQDAEIVARFVRELDWPGLVVKGGARLADLIAIAGAAEGVFMINRAPSAGARDLISRASYGELKAAIARHDPLGVAAKFLETFEAKRASTHEDVPIDQAFTDAVSEDDLGPPANLVVPNSAPAGRSNVVEPGSAIAAIANSGNESRVAAGGDARPTAASSVEAISRTPGRRREAPRLPRVGVTSNNLVRSPADPRAPSTVPIGPSEVAGPSSGVAPIASPGNDGRRVAAGGDVSRTAVSASEAIARTPGYRRDAPRLPRVGVASNSLPRSQAEPRGPGTAPIEPSEVAGLASAPIATSDNNSSREAAGADAWRTSGSSSEAYEGLEMLPENGPWKVKPDRSDARELAVGVRRQRRYQEDFDAFLRRKAGQSSEIRPGDINSPKSTRLRQPTRPRQPILQRPAEISAVSDPPVETEGRDYQAPRP